MFIPFLLSVKQFLSFEGILYHVVKCFIVYRGESLIKYLLPLLILTFSILYIFFILNEPQIVKLIFKLIPMILIIFYAVNNLPGMVQRTHYFILIGLLFSAVGDATLHWFIIGLSAFLIGHLFYISAFIGELSFSWLRLSFIIPLGVFSFWIGSHLIDGLEQQNETTLIIPVLIYIIAIMFMGLFAILTGNTLASIGSILFIISDSILAWNKFIEPIMYSNIFIMGSYYAAQFSIAGCLTNIAKNTIKR